MRWVRAIALGVAMLIAMPSVSAQVWKPKSRQKKQPKVQGTTEAKSVSPKTRKAGRTKSVKRTKKKPAAFAKKQKKKSKKPAVKKQRAPASDDDDYTIIEEDWPDED